MSFSDKASVASERTVECDSNFLSNCLGLHSPFRRLRTERIPEFFVGSHTFDYFKYYMLQRVENLLYQQIELFHSIESGTELKMIEDMQLIENLFSWGMEAFLQRRRLTNNVYIDVLKMESSAAVNAFKYQCDSNELAKYMSLIFDGAYSNMFDKSINIFQQVEKPILDTKKVKYKIDNIGAELHLNQRRFLSLFNELLHASRTRRHSLQQMTKLSLQNRIMNSHIWDPIETRYQLNWYKMKALQAQYRSDILLGSFEKDIQKWKYLQTVENTCNRTYMDYLYSCTGDLSNRVNVMQNKYDADCEAIDNRLIQKRIQIDKVKEQRRYLTEQIQRFHDEIEMMAIRYEKFIQSRERKKQMLLAQKNTPRKGRKQRGRNQKKGK